jgi:hypothetical protein
MTILYDMAAAALFMDPYMNYVASRHETRNNSEHPGIRRGILSGNDCRWEEKDWINESVPDNLSDEEVWEDTPDDTYSLEKDGYRLLMQGGDAWVLESPWALKCNYAFIGTAPGACMLSEWEQKGAFETTWALALGPEWFWDMEPENLPYPLENLVPVKELRSAKQRKERA